MNKYDILPITMTVLTVLIIVVIGYAVIQIEIDRQPILNAFMERNNLTNATGVIEDGVFYINVNTKAWVIAFNGSANDYYLCEPKVCDPYYNGWYLFSMVLVPLVILGVVLYVLRPSFYEDDVETGKVNQDGKKISNNTKNIQIRSHTKFR
jgi:uncharacterized membrane protein